MTEKEKLTPHTEVVAVEFDNFLDFVEQLSDDQKQVLAQKLIGQNSPLTFVRFVSFKKLCRELFCSYTRLAKY
jgi:hypothetical protein